jgi:hypothetical protein
MPMSDDQLRISLSPLSSCPTTVAVGTAPFPSAGYRGQALGLGEEIEMAWGAYIRMAGGGFALRASRVERESMEDEIHDIGLQGLVCDT